MFVQIDNIQISRVSLVNQTWCITHLVVDPDAAVALRRAGRRDGLDEDPQLLQPGVGANTHPDDAQAQAVRALVL